jgi:hypothetical protein
MVALSDDNMTKLDIAKSYPHLTQVLRGEHGLDPTNPSGQKSMRCLSTALNNLLSTTYELNISDISNNKISYIRVPWTNSDCSFLNSKKWVDTTIQIAGSKHGGMFELAYRVANHLLCLYKDSFLAAFKKSASTYL